MGFFGDSISSTLTVQSFSSLEPVPGSRLPLKKCTFFVNFLYPKVSLNNEIFVYFCESKNRHGDKKFRQITTKAQVPFPARNQKTQNMQSWAVNDFTYPIWHLLESNYCFLGTRIWLPIVHHTWNPRIFSDFACKLELNRFE